MQYANGQVFSFWTLIHSCGTLIQSDLPVHIFPSPYYNGVILTRKVSFTNRLSLDTNVILVIFGVPYWEQKHHNSSIKIYIKTSLQITIPTEALCLNWSLKGSKWCE